VGTIMARRSILFLVPSGIDNPSPRGRWLPVARELARSGHTVELALLHPTYDRLRPRRWSCDGVQIAHVGQMHVYGEAGRRRYFSPLKLVQVALTGAVSLAAYAVRRRPELIHIAKPQPINGLAGTIAARILGCPFYVDCDDYEAAANRFGGAWQRRLVQWWEDRLPPSASGVTVNTRFLYERCRSLGVPADRLAYVPNGIDPAQMLRPSRPAVDALRRQLGLVDQPVAIYLGTMSNIAHGVGLLVEAWAQVVADLPDARLLMVGDGDDREQLETQARSLGIDGAIRWTGRVPPETTRLYLALAGCSIDPVYDSPGARGRSPLKIVESLAQGVPVVTGDVGDRREVLGDHAGVVVAPGDSCALTGGILRLLRDSPARDELSRGVRERARAYTWPRLASTWATLYNAAEL
jgi:glycosyltransferase involved in cell wall biosynthesis